MNPKSSQKKKARYSFRLPAKLPSSLADNIINPAWKKLVVSIENQEVENVLTLIQDIFRIGKATCLPHPFLKNTSTYATMNIRAGMFNFIFFIDADGKNPWILGQCTSFVDVIFSKQYTGKHKLSTNDAVILSSAKKLFEHKNKIDAKKFSGGKAIFSGYLLDQGRPYHHFYDQLKWLLHLQTKRIICCDKSFFVPSNFKIQDVKQDKPGQFSSFPLVIGSNQLGNRLDQYTDQMEKIVCKDSLKSMKNGVISHLSNKFMNIIIRRTSKRKNRELVLWFGISGQKRIWVEQEDFLPNLVEQLKPWFDSFVFLIDGFTQYEDKSHVPITGSKEIPINQDLEVVESIRRKLLPFSNVSVLSLVGKTYRNKIQRCQAADFFIANAGAGQLVPHRFCKKPGILHSNEKHCVFQMGINNTTVKLVDKTLVNDVGNLFAKDKKTERSGPGLISYSINVQIIINMTIDMLQLREKQL